MDTPDIRHSDTTLSFLREFAMSGLKARKRSPSLRGFTLVELLVVTGIIILVSGVVLANNNRFGGRILLENLAYDVALSVRQAQVYGISVHTFGGNFGAGYGMHFDINSPATYVLFADAVSPNGLYDGCPNSASCELVQSTTIQGGYKIVDLCTTAGGSSVETCNLNMLDVLFKRPEPDAFISANGTSGVANPGALSEDGRIIVQSPRGDRMSILISAPGQISVQ